LPNSVKSAIFPRTATTLMARRGVPPHVADNVPNHIKSAIRGEMELAHKVANALEAAHRSW